MTSTGNDPYLESASVRFPAGAYESMTIEMSVDAAASSTQGQVFFLTEDDNLWNEPKSMLFDIVADGEMHTYELDMASLPSWKGMVALFRLDPGALDGAAIRVARIGFST